MFANSRDFGKLSFCLRCVNKRDFGQLSSVREQKTGQSQTRLRVRLSSEITP